MQLPSNVDVLISTYPNDIYKANLSGWRLKAFQSKTRKGLATEHLYMNFVNKEGILHDYRHLGTDYVDRQRIKRKIDRETNKLLALPATERNAIINKILEIYPA